MSHKYTVFLNFLLRKELIRLPNVMMHGRGEKKLKQATEKDSFIRKGSRSSLDWSNLFTQSLEGLFLSRRTQPTPLLPIRIAIVEFPSKEVIYRPIWSHTHFLSDLCSKLMLAWIKRRANSSQYCIGFACLLDQSLFLWAKIMSFNFS